jgi:hypothetical protein
MVGFVWQRHSSVLLPLKTQNNSAKPQLKSGLCVCRERGENLRARRKGSLGLAGQSCWGVAEESASPLRLSPSKCPVVRALLEGFFSSLSLPSFLGSFPSPITCSSC